MEESRAVEIAIHVIGNVDLDMLTERLGLDPEDFEAADQVLESLFRRLNESELANPEPVLGAGNESKTRDELSFLLGWYLRAIPAGAIEGVISRSISRECTPERALESMAELAWRHQVEEAL